jgi:spore maturation protein CgeB
MNILIIQEAGYNKSKNNHTYDNRCIELVKKLNQLI